MKRLVFIKFGGSLITDKTKEETINYSEIEHLAGQLKEALAADKDLSVLIGTGAGSFGHIQVKKFGLQEGVDTESKKLNFARVADSVSRLNRIAITHLLKNGIPAVSIHPSSIFLMSSGSVIKIFIDALTGFLKLRVVPVVYGDMVYDEIKGASVLSTDQQFLELIGNFKNHDIKVEKVIFCGATDGVIDLNGKTIKKIDEKKFLKIDSVFYKNEYVDVTGGMKKKVKISLEIANLGVKSYIIKGSDLTKVLIDNKFSGTVIE